MKKHIKLFVFIATLLLVFGIYNLLKGNSEKINYIALGDSVAEGMNPYGAVGYGYPDYVKDELLKNEKLKFYTKGFSKSGYTIENVKNDIENNKINVKFDFCYIFKDCSFIKNNEIIIDNDLNGNDYSKVFEYRKDCIKDINVMNNKIKMKRTVDEKVQLRLFSFLNTKLNDKIVRIENNEISSENMQKDSFYIFFQEMQDNTPQVIYMKNNKFDFFNQRGDYKNLTEYKIMEN